MGWPGRLRLKAAYALEIEADATDTQMARHIPERNIPGSRGSVAGSHGGTIKVGRGGDIQEPVLGEHVGTPGHVEASADFDLRREGQGGGGIGIAVKVVHASFRRPDLEGIRAVDVDAGGPDAAANIRSKTVVGRWD